MTHPCSIVPHLIENMYEKDPTPPGYPGLQSDPQNIVDYSTMFALIARSQQTTMLDGYIEYGAGDFDGQSSGHDYMGVSSNPSMNGSSSGPLFTRRLDRGREHNCDGNRQSLGAYRRAWTGWPCDSRAASGFCRGAEALCRRPCAEHVGTSCAC